MGNFFKAGKEQSTQDTKYSGTSSSTANLDERQQAMNKQLYKKILHTLQLGPEVSEEDRNKRRGAINEQYDTTGKMLSSQLAGQGFNYGGGKLGQGYGNLAIARNKAFGDVESDLSSEAVNRFQQMIQNAFQFNTPRSQTSTQSGTQNTVGTQPGPSVFDKVLGYAGQGLGAAAMFGVCWVAQALYGDTDPRVDLLRHWLVNVWARRSLIGYLFVSLYIRYGERGARIVKRYPLARGIARYFFDRLLWRAQYELKAPVGYSE